MASKRYVLCAPREYERAGEKKTQWVPLGSLWVSEKGEMSVTLQCLPVWKDFDGKMFAFEPRDKNAPDTRSNQNNSQRGGGGNSSASDMDDDLPF